MRNRRILGARRIGALAVLIAILCGFFAVPVAASADCDIACATRDLPATPEAAANALMQYAATGQLTQATITTGSIIGDEIAPLASGAVRAECRVDKRALQTLIAVIRHTGSVRVTDLNRTCANDGVNTCPSNSPHCQKTLDSDGFMSTTAMDIDQTGDGKVNGNDAATFRLRALMKAIVPQVNAGAHMGQRNCSTVNLGSPYFVTFEDSCSHQHADYRGNSQGLNVASTPPAPPLDSDGDGIPDSSDVCPFDAGYAIYDGCPLPRSANSTDFNGDGSADVFFAHPNGRWQVSARGTSAWRTLATGNIPLDRMQFADFNGDGVADVFWPDDKGQWWVSYSGTSPWTALANGAGARGEDLQLGDFDGDGKADVFWANPVKAEWWVSYGGTSAWKRLPVTEVPSKDIRIGDFNGDGKADVFYAHPDGSWLISDGGSSPWRRTVKADVPVAELKFGDVNGDGTTDVLWPSSTDGRWWVSYGTASSWDKGVLADVPAAQLQLADLNGDGKADVIWPRDSGAWLISSGARSSWAGGASGNVSHSLLVAR
ncbi:FG-GAP repeat domain-containing protein [Leifsonia sp. NPDC056665]|uniref:FG-GAP repeat domain-containing protein n=1 Tax=Leifsonia sp. NPDC056665 TaxID=3345901 RepID=UPI0036A46AE8